VESCSTEASKTPTPFNNEKRLHPISMKSFFGL
jgi:hypothetical protein